MTVFFRKRREAEAALTARLEALTLALEKASRASQEPPSDVVADLKRAVEGLQADVDWLTLELRKVRGKLTGGQRRSQSNGESEEGAAAPAGPPAKYSPAWFAHQRSRWHLPPSP